MYQFLLQNEEVKSWKVESHKVVELLSDLTP